MKKTLKQIFGTLLVAAVVMATGAYLYKNPNSHLLRAALFEDIDVDDIVAVTISLSGDVYAGAGGEVAITHVYLEMSGGGTEFITGADLTNSGITFTDSGGAFAGVQPSDNIIELPDDFSPPDEIVVDTVTIPDAANGPDFVLAEPLNIIAQDEALCNAIQMSMILPQGGGLNFPNPEDLPLPASTGDMPINFAGPTAASTLSFHYLHPVIAAHDDPSVPAPVPVGARTFDVSIDVVSGLPVSAQVVSNNGTGGIQAQIRDGGADTEETADNLTELFNVTLGADSPFVAYRGTGSTVNLVSKELGVHTNDYYCIVNGIEYGEDGLCFSGGGVGTGGLDVLNTPMTMNNIMREGETALIYVHAGVPPYSWSSSNESVLQLNPFGGEDEASVTFDPVQLTDLPTYDTNNLNVELTNCEEYASGEGGGGGGLTTGPDSLDCDVTVEGLVVMYDISANTYSAQVALEGEIVDVTNLTGDYLTGEVSGTGRWYHDTGLDMELTGTVQGTISGTAEGVASGTLTGTIRSAITVELEIGSAAPDYVSELLINLGLSFLVPATDFENGLISAVPGSFVSNIEILDDAGGMTPFMLAYPVSAGNSIVSVTDGQSCVAAANVEVAEMMLHLETVDGSDTLEEGDTLQVNAYRAWTDGTIDKTNNLAGEGGLTWTSSNPAVATVDASGLVTAVAPGTTSLSASWDTGVAEIGTVYSEPLVISVSRIVGLTIFPDETAQGKLAAATVNAAMNPVTIAIHSPGVVGSTLNVEGNVIPLGYDTNTPASLQTDIDKIRDIALEIEDDLEALDNAAGEQILDVAISLEYPGVLVIQPINQTPVANGGNPSITQNGRVDVSSQTSTQHLTIIPHFASLVDLPPNETYPLAVVAEYDNGMTKRLSPAQVNWVNTPAYLDAALLQTGVLKLGDTTGTSSVTAQFANADGVTIYSNALTVEVNAGPIVQLMQRLGFGDILKGMTIQMRAKLYDVNGMKNLAQIDAYVVKSNQSTVPGILADENAVWYGVQNLYQNDVTEVEVDVDLPGAEGEEGAEEPVVVEIGVNGPLFRTYDFPINIPLAQNLYNGTYKILFYFFDAENNSTEYIYPIYIGPVQPGDVNGNGWADILDVILTWRIFTGAIDPTASQLKAADANQNGVVNLLDVILVYQLYTSS